MYKAASERGNYIARTASHATKGSAKGADFYQTPDRVEQEVTQLGLADAEDRKAALLERLAVLQEDIRKEPDQNRKRTLGRDHQCIQLNVTVLNRHIKTLRHGANVLSEREKWRLAAKLRLSFPDAARLEATVKNIHEFVCDHGYPPADLPILDEYVAKRTGAGK